MGPSTLFNLGSLISSIGWSLSVLVFVLLFRRMARKQEELRLVLQMARTAFIRIRKSDTRPKGLAKGQVPNDFEAWWLETYCDREIDRITEILNDKAGGT